MIRELVYSVAFVALSIDILIGIRIIVGSFRRVRDE